MAVQFFHEEYEIFRQSERSLLEFAATLPSAKRQMKKRSINYVSRDRIF